MHIASPGSHSAQSAANKAPRLSPEKLRQQFNTSPSSRGIRDLLQLYAEDWNSKQTTVLNNLKFEHARACELYLADYNHAIQIWNSSSWHEELLRQSYFSPLLYDQDPRYATELKEDPRHKEALNQIPSLDEQTAPYAITGILKRLREPIVRIMFCHRMIRWTFTTLFSLIDNSLASHPLSAEQWDIMAHTFSFMLNNEFLLCVDLVAAEAYFSQANRSFVGEEGPQPAVPEFMSARNWHRGVAEFNHEFVGMLRDIVPPDTLRDVDGDPEDELNDGWVACFLSGESIGEMRDLLCHSWEWFMSDLLKETLTPLSDLEDEPLVQGVGPLAFKKILARENKELAHVHAWVLSNLDREVARACELYRQSVSNTNSPTPMDVPAAEPTSASASAGVPAEYRLGGRSDLDPITRVVFEREFEMTHPERLGIARIKHGRGHVYSWSGCCRAAKEKGRDIPRF